MKSCLDTEMSSFKESLKSVCRHSLLIFRSLSGLEPRSRLTYLMYHSVADEIVADYIYPSGRVSPEEFEKHIKFAVTNYDVLSIDEYLELNQDNKTPPRRSLVISFDDGYLDNLTTAMPILATYNVPATIYLATRYIDDSEPQWVDRLYSIFKYRNRHRVSVEHFQQNEWDLQDHQQQRQLFSSLCQLLLSKNYDDRGAILESLAKEFEFEAEIPRLTLSWDEVRKISSDSNKITLAIHTDQHLDLLTHKNELSGEVKTSFDKLKNAIDKTPRHFSYPYGRTFDGAHSSLMEFGIKSAVCSLHQFDVDPKYRHYYMNRIDAVKLGMRQWWYLDVKYTSQRWWHIDQ